MAITNNWSKIEKVVVRAGVTRRVFSGLNSMMVLNESSPHAKASLHSHPHEQLIFILEGEAKITLGDEALNVRPGDLLLVPPNVAHSLQAISSQICLNLDVFSPIREDYLLQPAENK